MGFFGQVRTVISLSLRYWWGFPYLALVYVYVASQAFFEAYSKDIVAAALVYMAFNVALLLLRRETPEDEKIDVSIPVELPSLGGEKSHEENEGSRLERFTREGIAILIVAVKKVVSRSLAWGFVGVVVGVVVFLLLHSFDYIAFSEWYWNVAVCIIFVIAGAVVMGYVGVFRGIGRTVIHVGVNMGYILYLIDRILERMSEGMLEDLPLEKWELRFKGIVEVLIGEEDPMSKKAGDVSLSLINMLRKYLFRKIETYLLAIVRKESSATGGGGISRVRVRQLAYSNVNPFFTAQVVGMINIQRLLGFLILTGIYGLITALITYY